MSLREALQAFLEHRHEVLVRRSNFRLRKIESRLEVLSGYLIAFLNIDEVIRIIREEDRPKEKLIKKFFHLKNLNKSKLKTLSLTREIQPIFLYARTS